MTPTITLVTTKGTLDLLGTTVKLEREGSIESILPIPIWDEEWATSPDTEGAKRIRSRNENPTAGGRVKVLGADDTTFRTNVKTWQEHVNAANTTGGTLNYTPTAGTAVAYEIRSMHITSLPQDEMLIGKRIQESDFEYTTAPFGMLTASTVTLGTAAGPIDAFTITDPGGSAPALGDIRFTDTASQSRGDLQFGIDEHWDATLNYPTAIAAGSMTTGGTFIGFAATRTGAWTTTATVRGTLLTQPLALCGVTSNHLGVHRVKARTIGTFGNTGAIFWRLKWRVGDGRFSENDWVQSPSPLGNFRELDLGTINIAPAEVGSQGWEGWVEAYSQTSGDVVDLAALEFLPADRYGRAYSPLETVATTLTAHDEFDQTAGTLTGKVAPLGGTWTFGGATSSETDFTLDTSNHLVTRTATSNTNPRIDYAGGATMTACVLRGNIKFSAQPAAAVRYGAVARWVDANNYLAVYLNPTTGGVGAGQLNVAKAVGGTLTLIGRVTGAQYKLPNVWYQAEITIGVDGRWSVAGGVLGGGIALLLSGQDDDLATGGTLASGRVGLYDYHPSSTAVTRSYDNVVALGAATPPTVINSGKSLRVTDDATQKEPTAGSVWAQAPAYTGSFVKLIPGRNTRLVCKARRGNVDAVADSGITDAFTVQLVTTPRVQLLT